MATISEKMTEVDKRIRETLSKVEADGGASVVLKAVMREFDKKSKKAMAGLKGANEQTVRDHVIELEQAADSAKAAAEADTGIGNTTRQAVLDAHMAICLVKADECSVG